MTLQLSHQLEMGRYCNEKYNTHTRKQSPKAAHCPARPMAVVLAAGWEANHYSPAKIKTLADQRTIMNTAGQDDHRRHSKVEIYSSRFCMFCAKAVRLLDSKGVEYQVHNVDFAPQVREEMQTRSSRTSVPQVFIDNTHIGGCDDLHELEHSGQLDALLHRDP